MAEIYGHTAAFNPFGLVDASKAEAQNPMEAMIGLTHTRVYHFGEIFFGGGIGFGLLPGYGSPKMRVFARAGYYMGERIDDADDDGIEDKKDKCPNEAEDIDGFQDEDGCPDPDNDNDGIPDEDDMCPNEPEDMDGFKDEDGCPEPDNDGDGILDAQDACPTEPEDMDGFKDEDGCPDPDNDGDGILDGDDKCPNEKEDFDEFEDDDGCPEPDNDKDGIPDYGDLCPLHPEDIDEYEDEDGCPDPDNDGDGILDAKDKCPNEPENINGIDDRDGCPDKGGKALVSLVKKEITLKAQPTFVPKKSALKPADSDVLNQLASFLVNHQEIEQVKMLVYTTSGGNKKKNLALSKEQMGVIIKYLTGKGVAKKRIKAEAMGDKKPAKGKLAGKSTRLVIEVTKKVDPKDAIPAVKPYGGANEKPAEAPASDEGGITIDMGESAGEAGGIDIDIGEISL